ncbi:MAG: LacI family DNA-binding transcriptional regulator [Homoserinimonas sp.]
MDVAAKAGVSLATASRAMTGRDGISKELALHVQSIAAELGYVANAHARSLAGGVATSIGLVVHEIGDPYFAEIASGVLRVAADRSRLVQISHADRTPASELQQVRMMRSHLVGAIIIAGSGYTDTSLESALARELRDYEHDGGRVAAIGRHDLPVDAVLPDNEAAGYSLGRHIRDLGHHRIGVVCGPALLNTVSDRLSGFLRAMEDTGLNTGRLSLCTGEFTREGGVSSTYELLAKDPGLTAIVALSDAMAVGVLHALRERGVRVPDKISVAGIDDITLAADVAPSLTTVRLPMSTMGALAVELILLPPASRPRRKHTGHELVVRDSTCPAPR